MSAKEEFPPPEEFTPEEYERQRAAYEEQLDRITTSEMILQSVVSLLNIGGRRMGLVPGAESARDLDQVRDAIDAVRSLLPVLERSIPAAELGSLREALSQLQFAYTRESAAAAGAPATEGPGATEGGEAATPADESGGTSTQAGGDSGAGGAAAPAEGEKPGERPGPAESSGRLWVPGR